MFLNIKINLMKIFLSKHMFWVVQIGSCLAFAISIFFALGVTADLFEKLLFVSLMFLTLFMPTSILRYLYRRFVNTDSFKIIDFVKVLVFLMTMVVLAKNLPYYFGYVLGRFFDLIDVNFGELEMAYKPQKSSDFSKYFGSFILFSGWTFFYFVIKQFRKFSASRIGRLELKDKIKQARLNTLKGHLNPQFMISSLQMIKELMITDVTLARNLITKLSETLRYSLTKNNINSVSLNEEFEIAENYVALLNLKAIEKYQIHFDLAPETLKNELPPMLLTNLMEIATKYGILQLEEGGTVLLSSKQIENKLEIKVTHSGKITWSSETELIEKTIRQRLKLLFEGKAEFNTAHELNNTTLLVNMPINEL